MKVLLAMSGGVDSSVAGAVLLDEGHDVVGVTMKLWGGESDTGCCSVSDVDDARRVAQQLGIDHLVFNFTEDFNTHVVDPYVQAHTVGITPNPCIECNRHLKFARLSERATTLGFDAVATGHHTRIATDANGVARVARGADPAKDQSYVVHMLDQREIARTMFPIGGMTKADVRARATEIGLRTAAKPDSQDVCFIGATTGRQVFLGSRIPFRSAVVRDLDGADIGSVEAVELVTIGQRRGLDLGGAVGRRYVVDVDPVAGVVTVGNDADLYVEQMQTLDLTWGDAPVSGDVLVQCSAHGATHAARLDGSGLLRWHEPQRRISPGQSVVFYDASDTFVLGGGIAA